MASLSVTEDQDQRDNAGLEDLTTMTIESLRARLLSERAISKSSRQRADELARRVLELEEQLRMVSIQRKKAERATADVLAILESNGISDASDAYYSNSEPETISDSKASGDATRRKESSSNLEVRRSDIETYSSSEIESSPSTGRSLSWKSSKDSDHSHQKTKYVETARRRSSTFTSNGTSFPKRVGKSCRRIRRRESRVVAEQMHNDANMHELRGSTVDASLKDSPACSNTEHTINHGVNVTPDALLSGSPEVKGANGYYSDKNAKNEGINGILQCQAQFRGQFEAEEKAQREWEEKVRENNGSVLDSWDPGNRSDVTEERDEFKASDQLNPKVTIFTERLGSNNSEVVRPSFTEQLEPKVAKNMAGPSHTDSTNSQAQQTSGLVASCSTSTGTQSPVLSGNQDKTPSTSSHISTISNGSGERPSASSQDGENSAPQKELALIPEKPANDLESVLGALQKARLSINQKLQGFPSSETGSSGRNTELSVPGIRPREKLEMPGGFSGLFRLPTDFRIKATARVNPGISYEEHRSSISLGDQSYGGSPTPYSNLQFYSHSPRPFIETRPAGFPPGLSGPHPSAMAFVERPKASAMPLGKFHPGSQAFDTSPSSSGRSSYVDPQMNHGPGRLGYVDPQMNHGPGRLGYVDPQMNHGPGRSGYVDPQMNHGPGRSGYVDPQMNHGPGRSGYVDPQMNHGPSRSGYVDTHMNRGLVLPRELEDRNDALYPEVTPQVFKDRFGQYVANSENGFSFYNDHFRPNA